MTGPTDPESATIVVGVDGSPGAQQALRWTATTAKRDHLAVLAVHVFEVPVLAIPAFAERIFDLYEAEWSDTLQQVLDDEWCAPLRDAGIPYETLLVDGDVGETLARLANERHATAIVIGTHRGLLEGFGPRRVAGQILRHAHQPLVIVPPND